MCTMSDSVLDETVSTNITTTRIERKEKQAMLKTDCKNKSGEKYENMKRFIIRSYCMRKFVSWNDKCKIRVSTIFELCP